MLNGTERAEKKILRFKTGSIVKGKIYREDGS